MGISQGSYTVMGEFLKSVDRVLALIRGLSAELKEVERKASSKQLSRIRKQLQDLAVEIDLVHISADDDDLTPAEEGRRKEVIVDIENKYEELKKRLANAGKELPEAKPTNTPSQALHFEARYMQRTQDQSIEELEGSVSSLKYLGHDINTELKTQNHLLKEFEGSVDANTNMMQRAQERLMHYVSQASNCNLVCLIVGLAVALFIVLLYL
mmetsp:Transcript_31989/g.55137  ORF Transcript_31989/g.55137 Transcript_31989/m.55137 type:complete len:211 (+) Transcript_31989:2813-3445(+)